MEVSGKKLCKPCLKQKSSTYTDRFCLHCEEEMCQSCFDTHVQFKVSQEHRLVKSFEIPLKAETPTLDIKRNTKQDNVQLIKSLDDLQRRYDKLERRFHEEVRLKDDALQR
ncbi:uncharacterized protein LOC132726165 [Ruditapes philippinarum]|uniref:uncharacterized protein LOC132726165 n=1 Tax=Ruditapes philippinarum TaxID=129788 RepID=UPI00295C2A55|nr:uncharacterized protein LOC132726165 [Ruditapes philippinarum]